MQTTDTDELDQFFEPIESKAETEADEAPLNETEAEEVETEDQASEADDEKDGEAETDDELSEDSELDDEADDHDEDVDEDDEEQPAESYTVKVDGKERTVTLEELQRGYSGQAYIQKGMEANKAQARALEQHAQTLQQQAQAVMQLYEQSQQTGFTPAPQEPDPRLATEDPIAYLEADAAYKTQLRQYQAEQQQIRFLHEQQQAQSAAAMRQHMQAQEQVLLEEMPELKNPKNADAFKSTLRKGAETYGYSKEEMREIVKDLRSVKALADAQKWRDLQAGKQAAKQPRQQPKAVTRPKGKVRDTGKVTARKQMQKAIKSQKDEDWVNVLLTPGT